MSIAISLIVIAVLTLIILILLYKLVRVEQEQKRIARGLFAEWKSQEEKKLRADAIKRSQAVLTGKVTEQLAPYLPDFPYNPRDCRFLGSPIDLVVFDGLSEGTMRDVVFMEIKTGQSAKLSGRERQVRDAIEAGKVSWKLFHIER